MKNLLLVFAFFCAVSVSAQEKPKTQIVETSCGQCNFGMAGKGCSLAVRMDEKSYWVDGTAIEDHGDSHGADGFCNVVRKAEVTGTVVDDRFKATSFKLLPKEQASKKKTKK